MTLFDGRLEWAEVQLLERSVGHLVVEGAAIGLLVVDRELLGLRHHPMRLDSVDVGDTHVGGEQRVLTEGLEGPSVLGHPQEVEGGPLDDVEALGRCLRSLDVTVGTGQRSGSKVAARPSGAGSCVTPVSP